VRKNPEETVMKWGWVLITLYMGPVALALYVLADKEPSPGRTRSSSGRSGSKARLDGALHRRRRERIIAAAAITGLLGLPMWIDFIVEYRPASPSACSSSSRCS